MSRSRSGLSKLIYGVKIMNVGQLIVQILVLVIFVGILYSLWRTTRSYGGLIGTALKWIGVGIVFFSLESLDRVLGELSFVDSLTSDKGLLVHNLIMLFGLLFSAIGFSRLTKITK